MKKTRKFLGVAVVLAVLLVVLFALASCGNSQQSETKKCETHTWGEWKVDTASTCATEGEQSRACTVCGEKETKPLGKADHTWGDFTTVETATCAKEGKEVRECSVCHTKEEKAIEKTEDHTWSPSLIEPLKIARRCSKCFTTEYTTYRNITNKSLAKIELDDGWFKYNGTDPLINGNWEQAPQTSVATRGGESNIFLTFKDGVKADGFFVSGENGPDYEVLVVYEDSETAVKVGSATLNGIKMFPLDVTKNIKSITVHIPVGSWGVEMWHEVALVRAREMKTCENHRFTDWSDAEDPVTCTKNGTAKRVCKDCGYYELKKLDKTPDIHDFGEMIYDDTLRAHRVCKNCKTVEYITYQNVTSRVAASVELAFMWDGNGATKGVWSADEFEIGNTPYGAKMTITCGKDPTSKKDVIIDMLFITGSGDVDYTVKVVYADSDEEVELGTGKMNGMETFLVDGTKVVKQIIIETAKGEAGIGSLENVVVGRARETKYCGEKTHRFDDGVVTKEPNCTEKGVKLFTCKDCGDTKTEEIPTVEGAHIWGEWVVTEEAELCTDTGKRNRTCTKCNLKVEEDYIGAHDFGDAEQIFPLYTVHTCSRCNKKGITNYTNITTEAKASATVDGFWKANEAGIFNGNWSTAEQNICSKPTTAKITITLNDKVKADALFVSGTNGPEYIVKALYKGAAEAVEVGRATLNGVDIFVLDGSKVVSAIIIDVPMGANGVDMWHEIAIAKLNGETDLCAHDFDKGTVTKEANCTEKGEKLLTCKVCGTTKTEEIEVNPEVHVWKVLDAITEATCTEDGVSNCECEKCGKTDTVVTPAAHKWGAFTYGELKAVHECSACNKTEVITFTNITNDSKSGFTVDGGKFWKANENGLFDGVWSGDNQQNVCSKNVSDCDIVIDFKDGVKADMFFISGKSLPNHSVKVIYDGEDEAVELAATVLNGIEGFALDNTKDIKQITVHIPVGAYGVDHWHELALATVSEKKFCEHTDCEWVVTTPATTEAEGVESNVCKDCGHVTETRTIDKLETTDPTTDPEA